MSPRPPALNKGCPGYYSHLFICFVGFGIWELPNIKTNTNYLNTDNKIISTESHCGHIEIVWWTELLIVVIYHVPVSKNQGSWFLIEHMFRNRYYLLLARASCKFWLLYTESQRYLAQMVSFAVSRKPGRWIGAIGIPSVALLAALPIHQSLHV